MQIFVQVALVLAVIGVSFALMRGGSNARHLAIRRMMLMLFALLAAFSIFFPTILTLIARFFGVGRGTDLVLYALIVSVLVFMATTYQRFRQMEETATKLARRLALDESDKSPFQAPPATSDQITVSGPEDDGNPQASGDRTGKTS
ncbi:DUF2304 domain-containing protein [Specibacter cremeus]|uniref:DUF2304 domain-containing protein n=1 Tax=Specibacter cremeus TaxID=1629051 RepID=UPI000F768909|nr:DUF2304 domain-containing protein [Specibacter cremeus]